MKMTTTLHTIAATGTAVGINYTPTDSLAEVIPTNMDGSSIDIIKLIVSLIPVITHAVIELRKSKKKKCDKKDDGN